MARHVLDMIGCQETIHLLGCFLTPLLVAAQIHLFENVKAAVHFNRLGEQLKRQRDSLQRRLAGRLFRVGLRERSQLQVRIRHNRMLRVLLVRVVRHPVQHLQELRQRNLHTHMQIATFLALSSICNRNKTYGS